MKSTDIRNIKQNLIKIDHHITNLCCYISVNKVPKGLKIKVTPQTPGIKTNNFYRRWDKILFECSTRILKLRPRKNIFGFAQNQ